MEHIIVPTDFSEEAKSALAFATELAKREDAEITLLHVVNTTQVFHPVYMDPILTSRLLKDLKTNAENTLEQWRTEFAPEAKTHTSVEELSLSEAIDLIVEERPTDLIVMGTKGSSGLTEFFVGSNTEKVVRFANVPVLTIPADSSPDAIKNILIPVQLDRVPVRFLEEVKLLRTLFQAKLNFVWIKSPHDVGAFDQLHKQFSDYLSAYFEGEDYSLFTGRDFLPEEAIVTFAKECNADMVAMATCQRKGIAHLFYGSTTESVVNHANVPVLAFPFKKQDIMLFEKTNAGFTGVII
ncbi:MAG: universal stress protein [Cytophagales bacterium]|nr:universal stress protein [Cytophagales bacterium]